MRKLLFTTFIIAASLVASSQAPIPFSWSVPNTILPSGVTMGITPGAGNATYQPGFYASNGNLSAPSVKLNGTGHFLTINIAAQGGVISYFLKGQNTTSAPFQGTLDVEFSANGTTWTSARTLVNADISTTSYTQFRDTCLVNTRYIRFFYTNKVSGVNLSLDDIEIGIPLPKPEAEIQASIGTDTVFSGSNYYTFETVASTKRINVIIENQGTDSTLKISGVTSSNSAEFSVVSFPSTVDSLSSDTLKIDFTPSAAGTRTSTISIANNDATENPYIINMIGYGNGLATEPATPASIAFSNVVTYDYDVTITPTTPLTDESYLVLFKRGSAPTGVPVDGVEYSAGESIGNAKVAYVGKNLSYSAKEVYANSTYHVAVFSYSGFGTYSNYSATPRTGTVTTPVTMQPANYYNSISTSDANFVDTLTALINPHTLQFYSDFDDTYINEFTSRDTTNNQKVVTCAYSSDEYIYTPPFNFSVVSREHTYPQSWMPTFGDQTKPEYNDYHNLYPANQNNANAVRSNKPLGEVVTVISTFKDGTYGRDARGRQVYEPRDSHKGNAARAMMYMAIAYNGIDGNDWSLPDPIDAFSVPYGQEQDVLKKWHWQDPVDEEEMARNDYIASLQNNRNPFIDSMNYVCYIDFMTMNKETNIGPCITKTISLEENTNLLNLVAYPNPTNNVLNLAYSLQQADDIKVQILNNLGQMVGSTNFTASKNGLEVLDVSHLTSGIYHIKLTGSNFDSQIKFIKQ